MNIEKVIFWTWIIEIDANAFSAKDTSDALRKQIKYVEFPETLTWIGDYAFYGNKIESLALPSVEIVWDYAFYGNQISWMLELPSSLKTI